MPHAFPGPVVRRRLVVAGVATVALAASSVLLLPDGRADGRRHGLPGDPPTVPDGPPTVTPRAAPDMDPVDRSAPAQPLPTLTRRHRAQIRRLVATSAPIRAAARGAGLRVVQAVPWDTDSDPERLIGAVVTVRLSRSVALDHVPLPTTVYDSSDHDLSPYKSTVYAYTAPRVRRLWVEIDVHRDRVVGVAPDLGTPDVESELAPGAVDPKVPPTPGD